MAKFGTVPKEVPVQRTFVGCAPPLERRVRAMLASLAGGREEWPFETIRTENRQMYLYGFGRFYDDGRGRVTNAQTALKSWHSFGMACDVVEKDATPWDAPKTFWDALGAAAKANDLAWGGDWSKPDLPHVQLIELPASPTPDDIELYWAGGVEAVWVKYSVDQ